MSTLAWLQAHKINLEFYSFALTTFSYFTAKPKYQIFFVVKTPRFPFQIKTEIKKPDLTRIYKPHL